MTTASNQPSAATRQTGGGQPPPGEHDPYDEHPRHQNRDEQGEQWQHGERDEQALISKATAKTMRIHQ